MNSYTFRKKYPIGSKYKNLQPIFPESNTFEIFRIFLNINLNKLFLTVKYNNGHIDIFSKGFFLHEINKGTFKPIKA